MKCGLHVPNFDPFADPSAVADLAAAAEASGWSGLFLWDHVARGEGVFAMCDPWIALAAAAAATSRLRLGPLEIPLVRRRPWNLARQVVTLDHLSGGRVVLGVGLGVSRGPEFAGFGEETDLRLRGDLRDEGLEILQEAWTGEAVTHSGPHYTLDGIAFEPHPVQASVPIWAAAERVQGRPVHRAALLDGVFPFGLSPAKGAMLLDEIRQLRPAGTDGYDLVAAGVEDWEEWQSAGATWWLRVLSWSEPLSAARTIVESGPVPG